ncbi:MAG: sporulation protein YunB [Clostridiaceae bacterium]|nr:sporulation protein YunB [Clostridiaceae bacterium]MDY5888994.1 sporulation protein YunB [Oscillospiraceae bacterium]
MKRKRKITPIAVAFLTVAIGALLILAEVRISNVRRDLLNYAARDAASSAATKGIEKSLDTDRVKYSDLIKFGRDENGNIVSVTTDAYALNKIGNNIGTEIDNIINEMKSYVIKIPVTVLFSEQLINGRGPKIPMIFVMTGITTTDFENEFTAAGVNQTHHRIMMNITVNTYVIHSGNVTVVPYKTNVCIAESIVVGITPQTFAEIIR